MHVRAWLALAGLVADGAAFARGQHKRGLLAPGAHGGGAGKAKGNSKTENSSGGDKQKRKSGKAAQERTAGSYDAGVVRPPESSAAAGAAISGGVVGTTAGDGGRWVHVPTGGGLHSIE